MWINDTLIHDDVSARDFLSSLGLDQFDIEEFVSYLTSEKIEWKEEAESWKIEAEAEYDTKHAFLNEVQNLADNLATGKGGTKLQYARKFLDLCEQYW